jgi:hypothetical protein
MSDMKTFTVRDMDREPSTVLDACDREGEVRIRRRDGRIYTLQAENGADHIIALPDFEGRLHRIFKKPLSARQIKLLDKLVAGE